MATRDAAPVLVDRGDGLLVDARHVKAKEDASRRRLPLCTATGGIAPACSSRSPPGDWEAAPSIPRPASSWSSSTLPITSTKPSSSRARRAEPH
jgi:hypothetical protein